MFLNMFREKFGSSCGLPLELECVETRLQRNGVAGRDRENLVGGLRNHIGESGAERCLKFGTELRHFALIGKRESVGEQSIHDGFDFNGMSAPDNCPVPGYESVGEGGDPDCKIAVGPPVFIHTQVQLRTAASECAGEFLFGIFCDGLKQNRGVFRFAAVHLFE